MLVRVPGGQDAVHWWQGEGARQGTRHLGRERCWARDAALGQGESDPAVKNFC